MATVSAEEIAVFARQAGWSGPDLVTAIAVALAESGGRTDARGDLALQTAKWGPSIGLWQIRSLKAEKGKGTTRDEDANLNPATNAKHAYEIWRAKGWGEWTTYTGRQYLLFVPRATPAAAGVTAVTTAADAADAATAVPRAILTAAAEPVRVLKWLQDPGTQTRVAKVMVGGALVVVALAVFVWPVVPKTAKVVGSVTKKVV